MKYLHKLILFCIFIGLGLLLCEGITRIFLVKHSSLAHVDFQLHPKYGWVHRAGTSKYNIINGEKPVRIEFNSSGYRDIEYDLIKPPQTKRIVVIGDSFSAATQVDFEKTYWHKLQTLLNEQSVYRWEVINFGIGAYGTIQEYMTLKEQALKYNPDAIIFQIYPLNDICDNTMKAAFVGGPQDYYRPYANPKDDYETITYIHPIMTFLRNHSSLVMNYEPSLVKIIRSLKKLPAIESDENKHIHASQLIQQDTTFKADDFRPEDGRDSMMFNTFAHAQEQFAVIKEGWKITDKYINKIIETSQTSKIPLVMVVMPFDAQLDPKYAYYEHKYPFHFDRYYADNRIAQLASPYNIPVISLIDLFNLHGDKVLPYVDGHLNKNANALVAQRLKDTISSIFPESSHYDQKVFFDLSERSRETLVSGFELPEKTHVWTTSQRAELSFEKLPNISPEKNYVLSLRAIPFAPVQLGTEQYVDIFVNNNKITRWAIPVGKSESVEFDATIPGEILNRSETNIAISLSFSDRKSPKDLGISADPRLLGLALVSIQIREVLPL